MGVTFTWPPPSKAVFTPPEYYDLGDYNEYFVSNGSGGYEKAYDSDLEQLFVTR